MYIIAVEGIDKSGKATQVSILVDKLHQEGYKVMQSEFPRYDTIIGQLIRSWLYKEWDVDQITFELLQTIDKQAQQNWFRQLEEDGYDFLVLDRYTSSQRVYARSNNVDRSLIDYLQMHIRKPDVSFLINITAEESMKRKGKHGDNDRYESDLNLLKNVRGNYLIEILGLVGNVIDGMQPAEIVSDDIWDFMLRFMEIRGIILPRTKRL